MLVHKSCDLGHVDGDRKGIYFLGNISVSFEAF